MIGYRERIFFDGQDVTRNIAIQQIMDMKYVVWEYMESNKLAQNNVGGNEFSVSIKAGIMTIFIEILGIPIKVAYPRCVYQING
jgi:hypothetical protein